MKYLSFRNESSGQKSLRIKPKIRGIAFFTAVFLTVSVFFRQIPVFAAETPALVILSQYNATMNIGEEFLLAAVTSTLKQPVFKSSSSRIASVNTYGRVTAKQAGTCRITAKAGNGEAACKLTVKKTTITLNTKRFSLEIGESARLKASTSNGSEPSFRCNKTSVAVIDSNGMITACKPGSAVITVKADKTTATCQVTVKKPTLKLNRSSVSLFRCQQFQLESTVSSGAKPSFRSSCSSVATVSDTGLITAMKHGAATITANTDGISKTCQVTVKSPSIKLSAKSISMKVGNAKKIHYTVSSGNIPEIKSSKPSVADADQSGRVTAYSAGTAVISFTEDGTRAACKVTVKK